LASQEKKHIKKDLRKLAKLLYVADFCEKKPDFHGKYDPPMTERYIG